MPVLKVDGLTIARSHLRIRKKLKEREGWTTMQINKMIVREVHMRSVQVSKANGPFEIVERDIPEPGAAQVRIKVQACGVCHSDSFTKEGLFPGIQYPRVPGHEIAGVIDKVGKDITQWQGNVLIILITNGGPGSVIWI